MKGIGKKMNNIEIFRNEQFGGAAPKQGMSQKFNNDLLSSLKGVTNRDLLVNYDNDRITISARELYKQLDIQKRFSVWFETNSKGFEENEDFYGVYLKVQCNQYGGEQELQDYQLTTDMAKHVCMMSRTEKGKQYRAWLIQLEKAWNSPEMVMKRALEFANKRVEELINTVNAKQKQLEIKDEEIEHKENVIIGLVDDIDLATKRQRINQIVRRGCVHDTKKLSDRWELLYSEFSKKYHVNLKMRFLKYKDEYKPRLKNKLDLIDKEMNMIPQLYEVTCKLFENDFMKLMEEWEYTIQK